MRMLSINEISTLLGKGTKQVARDLAASGLEPTPGPKGAKLFPSDRAIRAIVCGTDGSLNAEQERAKLHQEQRLAVQQKRLKEAHELLPMADLRRGIANSVTAICSALDGLPDRMAPVLAAESDQRRVLALLREEVDSMRTVAADELDRIRPGQALAREDHAHG